MSPAGLGDSTISCSRSRGCSRRPHHTSMGLTCSRCTCCCPQPTYTSSTAATTATSGQPPSSQVLKKVTVLLIYVRWPRLSDLDLLQRTSSTSRDVSASSDTAINVMTRPSSTSRLGLCLRPKRFRGSRGRLRRSRSLDSGPDIPLHEIDAMEKRQKLRRRSQAPTVS